MPDDELTQPKLLRCAACGKTVGCTDAEFRTRVAAGVWPACCGRTMSLALEAVRPRAPKRH